LTNTESYVIVSKNRKGEKMKIITITLIVLISSCAYGKNVYTKKVYRTKPIRDNNRSFFDKPSKPYIPIQYKEIKDKKQQEETIDDRKQKYKKRAIESKAKLRLKMRQYVEKAQKDPARVDDYMAAYMTCSNAIVEVDVILKELSENEYDMEQVRASRIRMKMRKN
jgi:hypothetical protein